MFLLFCNFFSTWFHLLLRQFYSKSDTMASNQFFLNYTFIFSLQSSKMSRNMRKLCLKLCNVTIYPPWGSIVKKYLFLNIPLPHLKCETCSKGDICKISRRRITDLKNPGPYKSQFCKQSVGASHFWENWLAITFTCAGEA